MIKQPDKDPEKYMKWYSWLALFVASGFGWWCIYEVVTHSFIMRLFN